MFGLHGLLIWVCTASGMVCTPHPLPGIYDTQRLCEQAAVEVEKAASDPDKDIFVFARCMSAGDA